MFLLLTPVALTLEDRAGRADLFLMLKSSTVIFSKTIFLRIYVSIHDPEENQRNEKDFGLFIRAKFTFHTTMDMMF